MRASRLLAILILLQLRTRLTAAALAEEFEVSMRTIYRDIDSLSAAGVPVYGDRGPGGGFQLLEGYRTRLTGLDADEAEAMLMIGMPGPAAALGLGAAASRARGKLLASLPQASLEGAGRIAARFHFDPVDWYRAADAAPYLPAMARAVLDQRQVAMTYESWRGPRDWRIDPLGLVMKGGAWYAAARSGAKIMTFRISSLLAFTPLETYFERPADFDLPRYWADSQTRFEKELRPHIARLRLSPIGLLVVSAVLATCGLFALSKTGNAGIVGIFAAATLYALGKTFFWPTMLGITAEQSPRGGALTLNTISGIGMLAVGILGFPFIGAIQEKTSTSELMATGSPAVKAVLVEKSYLLGKYEAIDPAKEATLTDDKDKAALASAKKAGQFAALGKMAIFPAFMLACYLILFLYFKSKGGYKPVSIGEGTH